LHIFMPVTITFSHFQRYCHYWCHFRYGNIFIIITIFAIFIFIAFIILSLFSFALLLRRHIIDATIIFAIITPLLSHCCWYYFHFHYCLLRLFSLRCHFQQHDIIITISFFIAITPFSPFSYFIISISHSHFHYFHFHYYYIIWLSLPLLFLIIIIAIIIIIFIFRHYCYDAIIATITAIIIALLLFSLFHYYFFIFIISHFLSPLFSLLRHYYAGYIVVRPSSVR
jgi:hypothetical protein